MRVIREGDEGEEWGLLAAFHTNCTFSLLVALVTCVYIVKPAHIIITAEGRSRTVLRAGGRRDNLNWRDNPCKGVAGAVKELVRS